VVFYIILAIVVVVLIGFLAWLLTKLNALLEEYRAKIDPLLEKADRVLTVTGDRVNSIGEKAETILTQGEEVATSVHTKVDRTAAVVQRTINAPLIGVNSLAAGITQAWGTFARLQNRRADGTGRRADSSAIPVPVGVSAGGIDRAAANDNAGVASGLPGKEI
jgi:hypothetical protein